MGTTIIWRIFQPTTHQPTNHLAIPVFATDPTSANWLADIHAEATDQLTDRLKNHIAHGAEITATGMFTHLTTTRRPRSRNHHRPAYPPDSTDHPMSRSDYFNTPVWRYRKTTKPPPRLWKGLAERSW